MLERMSYLFKIFFSIFLIASVLQFFAQKSEGDFKVYYVRVDGGTNIECDGLVDAPYPGSGVNQPCAWSHPFYALNQDGEWILKGGDTLFIHRGSYKMGLDGIPSNFTNCSSDFPWDCHLPPIPSGPDPQHPTKILGEGYDGDCSIPPELWGTERASAIFDLTGSSNVIIDCFEITDHSGCAYNHCDASVSCKRDEYPYGDYADVGIEAFGGSNITFRNLNIHGLAISGLHIGNINNLTLENVRLAGNGWAGWDGDVGEDSSFSGKIAIKKLLVEWNGCPEKYPSLEPSFCWGQNTCGGYGDGVGVARSGGNWLIEDSVFRYNVSDGLDLLYVGVDHEDSFIRLERCSAYGNAGNQLKLGGESQIINCLSISNCAFFYNKPFGRYMGGLQDGDICRAGGASLSINLPRGKKAYIVNSTIGSHGWAEVEMQCNNLDFPDQPPCDGSERVYLFNNLFYGYKVVYLDYERLTDFIGDGDPYHFTSSDSIDNNLIYNCYVYENLSLGSENIFDAPSIVNGDIDCFDGHLAANSIAIDKGLVSGSLNGIIPYDDIEKNPRDSRPDLGAYEYMGAAVCTLSCNANVPSRAFAGNEVQFVGNGYPSQACSMPPSYFWDFGDGSTSSLKEPSHVYEKAGIYNWKLNVSVDNVTCSKSGSIEILPPVTPPTITNVYKKSNPFRLVVEGQNFHPSCMIMVNGSPVPTTVYKSENRAIAKGGSELKNMIPKGVQVEITIKNMDDGGVSQPYYFTR